MVQEDLELVLRSDQAQALMLVRALEEDDARGSLLPFESRRRATVEARQSVSDDDGWMAQRAEVLVNELEAQWPFLRRLLRWADVGRGLWLPVAAAALILGLSTNALGPDRKINILALPLVGILLWNITVLGLLALRRLIPIGSLAWRTRPYLLDVLEGWARRLVQQLSRQARESRPADGSLPGTDLPGKALTRFMKDWFVTLSPLSTARLRGLLHLASLALLAGVVLGMYLRGIVFEYQAVWESTFLTARSVEDLLGFVLAPASWILGLDISAVLQAGTAAPLIHLWAATAAWVAVPRVVLLLSEIFQVARYSIRLPISLPGSYLHRLLAAVSSDAHRVDVMPYSYRLVAALSDTLRARLLDVFGVRANIVIHNPVEYGVEPQEMELLAGRCWMVVFNLSQTPEIEVHGEFLRFLSTRLPQGQVLIPVVEASSFQQRWPKGPKHELRWQERQRAWDRVLGEAGMNAVHLDLRHDDANSVISGLSKRVNEADD